MKPTEWLNENLGDATGALTGADTRAINAAHAVIELYSYTSSPESLVAFANVVSDMQTSTRWMAYHIIAMVMDWDDREIVWAKAGLPAIESPKMSETSERCPELAPVLNGSKP